MKLAYKNGDRDLSRALNKQYKWKVKSGGCRLLIDHAPANFSNLTISNILFLLMKLECKNGDRVLYRALNKQCTDERVDNTDY